MPRSGLQSWQRRRRRGECSERRLAQPQREDSFSLEVFEAPGFVIHETTNAGQQARRLRHLGQEDLGRGPKSPREG
jgi:hypothetical protein